MKAQALRTLHLSFRWRRWYHHQHTANQTDDSADDQADVGSAGAFLCVFFFCKIQRYKEWEEEGVSLLSNWCSFEFQHIQRKRVNVTRQTTNTMHVQQRLCAHTHTHTEHCFLRKNCLIMECFEASVWRTVSARSSSAKCQWGSTYTRRPRPQ